MKNRYEFLLILSLTYILGSCNTANDNSWQGEITGKAQKGPFINGASIFVNELDDNLVQTGRSFNSDIQNNAGEFDLTGVSLTSARASIRVDGYYFNEVCGTLSESPISLNGIVDASTTDGFNLNVMTHLENGRVQALFESGASFQEAKSQAQSELLQVFGMNLTGINTSETLDMSGNSDGDAVMIAISCIMQGHRNEAVLSSTLADFVTDFTPDGELNDSALISSLVLHAQSLELSQIRTNIETRYNDLGLQVTVPDFESRVNDFLNAYNPVSNRSVIDFPENGANGANVLNLDRLSLPAGGPYSLAANMPDNCMSVRIKISKVSGPPCGGCWTLQTSSNQNWIKESYDQNNHTQFFNSNGQNCDLKMTFSTGIVQFEYFEQGAADPTLTKVMEFN